MKRLIITLLLVMVMVPNVAAAETPVAVALRAAATYWGSYPMPCSGNVSVVYAPLPDSNAIGWAEMGTCVIHITPEMQNVEQQVRQFALFCQIVIHEVGHLILGNTFFANSNPTDAAHSPDVTNIMYAKASTLATPAICIGRAKIFTISYPIASPRLAITDDIVTWRGFSLRGRTKRILACAPGEQLQSKLWTIGGKTTQTRISSTAVVVHSHANRVSVRGACEPSYSSPDA